MELCPTRKLRFDQTFTKDSSPDFMSAFSTLPNSDPITNALFPASTSLTYRDALYSTQTAGPPVLNENTAIRSAKRARELDDEDDKVEDGYLAVDKAKGGETAPGSGLRKIDLKRLRFTIERGHQRFFVCDSSSSSDSNSSLDTPASYSPPGDPLTDPYPSRSGSVQERHGSHSSIGSSHLPHHHNHYHKLNPIRISTRSDASSSSFSSSSLRNPYDTVNTVLYLAHLTRHSQVVGELEEDLGEMELDEGPDTSSAGSSEPMPSRGWTAGGGGSAVGMDIALRNYEQINSILREAFLKRHRMDAEE